MEFQCERRDSTEGAKKGHHKKKKNKKKNEKKEKNSRKKGAWNKTDNWK